MITQTSISKGLGKLFSSSSIVSISGSAGTGRTTLALQLVGEFLIKAKLSDSSCVWVQASKSFPKRRFSTLFDVSKDLRHLEGHIFVIPKKTISSYAVQLEILTSITQETKPLPPFVEIIVIDNISNLLRYQMSMLSDGDSKKAAQIKNDFFDNQFSPLVMFCKRKGIKLVLIHEVSYNPGIGHNVPFFHGLYDKITSLQIRLEKDIFQGINSIKISKNDSNIDFRYKVTDSGIEILSGNHT